MVGGNFWLAYTGDTQDWFRRERFAGKLDDVRVYARVLSQPEVENHYAATRAGAELIVDAIPVPHLRRLTATGTILCAYRQTKPNERRGVGLSYSIDAGESWVEQTPLYRASVSPDCGYPSLVRLAGNTVFCVHCTEARNDACYLQGVFLEEQCG